MNSKLGTFENRMNAIEFEDEYRMLRDEVYSATLSWHSYLTVNSEIATNETLLDALNRNPSFWVITVRALQHTAILTLGRIFDKDTRSRSIHLLTKACVEHPEIFSKNSLRARRKKDAKADWFEHYIANAFEPDAAHFKALTDEVVSCSKMWNAAYEPIRNKVVAHRDRLSKEAVAELFSKTKVADITDLLQRIYTIEYALQELLWNASRLSFARQVNPRVAEAEGATKGMLASILKGTNG